MQQEHANFILPKTEEAVNRILKEISSFFSIVTLCVQGLYALYLGLRLILERDLFVITLILFVIALATFAVNLARRLLKKDFGPKLDKILHYTGLAVRFLMLVSIFYGIAVAPDRYSAWNMVSLMLMFPAWLLSVAGDIFCSVVPRWTTLILDNFKEDIEIRGLAGRSIEKVGEAAKEMLHDGGRDKIVMGAGAVAAATVALPLLKSLFGRKKR